MHILEIIIGVIFILVPIVGLITVVYVEYYDKKHKKTKVLEVINTPISKNEELGIVEEFRILDWDNLNNNDKAILEIIYKYPKVFYHALKAYSYYAGIDDNNDDAPPYPLVKKEQLKDIIRKAYLLGKNNNTYYKERDNIKFLTTSPHLLNSASLVVLNSFKNRLSSYIPISDYKEKLFGKKDDYHYEKGLVFIFIDERKEDMENIYRYICTECHFGMLPTKDFSLYYYQLFIFCKFILFSRCFRIMFF